jgi:hypothetical protein
LFFVCRVTSIDAALTFFVVTNYGTTTNFAFFITIIAHICSF